MIISSALSAVRLVWEVIDRMIAVTESLSIPEEELTFTASLSSGPGGQHVNKVSSRITLWFNVAGSPSLSEDQKALIAHRLANRIGKDGLLRVICQQSRSQAANRETAIERFVELLRAALKREKPRKKTRVSAAAKQRRLEDKKQRGFLKRERTRKVPLDD